MKSHMLRIALILLVLISTAQAEITVTGSDGHVSLYVHNLDMLRQRYKTLSAEVRLGSDGPSTQIDLAAPWQAPAMLVVGDAAGKVSAIVRGDGKVIENFEGDVAQAKASGRITLTDKIASVEPGSAMQTAPTVRQPNLTKLESIPFGDTTRVIDWKSTEAQVQSATNFPSIGSNNLCAVSRQTDHPDDPSRRSLYIPLQGTMYGGPDGTTPARANFLAEVPLDPKWLDGEGDRTITLAPGDIRVHTTVRRWPEDDPNGQLITGQTKSGMGQMANTLAIDDDGNLYYAGYQPTYVLRFNVHTAQFEAPPIDIREVMNENLPDEKSGEPEELRKRKRYFDYIMTCGVSGGRLFVQPYRYAAYENVRYSGVFSLPLDHWDNPDRFQSEMRMLARGWPGSDISLYDYWPEDGKQAGQIVTGVVHEGSYYFRSYTLKIHGGPWRIELNDDGSAKRVHPATWEEVDKAMQAHASALTATASGKINWWDYGILTATREQLRTVIAGTHDGDQTLADGTLTIYYDVVAAMHRDPERYGPYISDGMGPSVAPHFMLVDVPGEPGVLLGASETKYYLASYDVSNAAQGVVTKRYLPLDLGVTQTYLPAMAGLNPYDRLWWRNGDDLYLVMTGYTGIASLHYRHGDSVLERFDSRRVLPPNKSLDGAPNGRFLRERFPVLGIDNRVYLAGANVVDRAGTPYSTGLGVFSPPVPEVVGRVANMSRGRATGSLLTRVVHDPKIGVEQQFILAGGMTRAAYLELLSEAERPKNHDAHWYFYRVTPGEEPQSVLGISLPTIERDGERKSSISRQTLSRDRRFLISIQMGRLLSFDLDRWQYADGFEIDETQLWQPTGPDSCLIESPDDRTFICVQQEKSNVAVFHELIVSPAGEISFRPHLKLQAEYAANFTAAKGGVFAFTPDGSGDGSYDLCIGPNWREARTSMWVIPDFIEPRQ